MKENLKVNENWDFYKLKCSVVTVLYCVKEVEYCNFHKTFTVVASGTAIKSIMLL